MILAFEVCVVIFLSITWFNRVKNYDELPQQSKLKFIHNLNNFLLITSLKLLPRPFSLDQMIKIIENELPHFIVRMTDVNSMHKYTSLQKSKVLSIVKYFGITNVIDYEKKSHIAYKIDHGTEELFIYFKYIDFDFYLVFLFTMIILSILIIIMRNKRTMGDLCKCMFTLSTVMFNSVDFSSMTKKINYKLAFILGPWFFSAFLITIIFNNLLLDFLVKALPEQVITGSYQKLLNSKQNS